MFEAANERVPTMTRDPTPHPLHQGSSRRLDRYYLALSVLVVRLTPVKGFRIRFARLFPQCGVYKWLTAGREFEEASAGGGTSGWIRRGTEFRSRP